MEFTRSERISLKLHPELDEKWVQDLIATDPSILGLGELTLRDKERIQPRAGRLDLLLQDSEAGRRYEVEVQLGPTDETHIIRTLEYWDIEKKRYPQYEHCAVLIAEDITSRFLNVIALFNGTIPLIALQMQALKVGTHTTLVFTKVMDQLTRGLVDEDEPEPVATNRTDWEERATKSTVQLADELLAISREIEPTLELKYTKYYIGLSKDGRPFNFITFRPQKNVIRLAIRLPRADEIDTKIEQAGIETLEYRVRSETYRLSLSKKNIVENRALLKELILAAYENRTT